MIEPCGSGDTEAVRRSEEEMKTGLFNLSREEFLSHLVVAIIKDCRYLQGIMLREGIRPWMQERGQVTWMDSDSTETQAFENLLREMAESVKHYRQAGERYRNGR